MSRGSDVRPSPIAGHWYPGDPHILAAFVDRSMDEAQPVELTGEIVAVMAPHAGYEFSGLVAGAAFAVLRGLDIQTVIIASPMHQPYYEPLLTSAHQAYETPLGLVKIDIEALQELDASLEELLGVRLRRVRNDMEHSLEIELPFLQRALPGPFSLVPIMVRDQSLRTARSLGEAFRRLVAESHSLSGKRVLLVASTDLSHFYPQRAAVALDSEVLRVVETLDPEGVIRVEEEAKGFACGRGALAAVLFAAKALGANHSEVLKYATSGEARGDYDRVVGYGAAVMTRQVETIYE